MDLKVAYKIADANSGMTDIERLASIYAYASSVLDHKVKGDFVEVGCNSGWTSIFLQMILDEAAELDPANARSLHLFDSFEGLPAPGVHDEYLAGVDLATTESAVRKRFDEWGLRQPFISKGWFADTLSAQLPDSVSFCYLDGDFEQSTKDGLEAVYPRLTRGAVLIVDDYGDEERAPRSWGELPGVKLACDAFFADKPEKPQALIGVGDLSFGLVRKQ